MKYILIDQYIYNKIDNLPRPSNINVYDKTK